MLVPNLTFSSSELLRADLRIDRLTETRKLAGAAQEGQVPLEGLTNTDERTATLSAHEPESQQTNM